MRDFDDFDEIDQDEGFNYLQPFVHPLLDDPERDWYSDGSHQYVWCDFGLGDSEGFCVLDTFGCHLVECELLTEED